MASITIANVSPALKQRFQVACARANKDMSAVLRAWLLNIILATEVDAETYEQELDRIRRGVLLEEGEYT